MVLHTFVETKIKLMKKIFLFSLLLLSTQVVAQNFDDLVNRTMNGKLTPYDFNNSKYYMIGIDTIGAQVNLVYNDVVNITNNTNRLSRFFKDGKIIDTQVYKDDITPNLTKHYLVTRMSRHNKIYKIEWWFDYNDDKLSALTIVRK
jgi:hypothetical protein